jgi:acetyl esterase
VPLKPEVKTFLDQLAAAGGRPVRELSVEEARQAYTMLSMLAQGPEVEVVEDSVVAGVPVRMYRTAAATESTPALVWFHGGGWVFGDRQTADSTCRELAVRTGCTVVSVDYRRAPEHPFPAAVDDAWAVTKAVAAGATRVAVGGDSAGGNLAAVMALRAAEEAVPVAFQLLVYPVTDLRLAHPSIEENAEGYLLTRDTMLWFREQYLANNEADVINPLASPLLADDAALRAVAPAMVVTAEFDPLRDEGDAYAEKLRAAGVDVEHVRLEGQIHEVFRLVGMFEDSERIVARAAEAVRKALVVDS